MRKHQLNKHKLIVLGLITSVLFSCKNSGTETLPTPEAALPPAKAVLLLPAQNEVCASGENQTSAESTVRFDWSNAANANNYVLTLKNLITGTVSDYTSSKSELKITIPRATAFSWTVTSKSSKSTTTAISNSWKFYNSGEGQIYYAPFPATLTFPAMGQVINTTSNITLTWSGSDADNDIASYDVYVGKSASPTFVANNKPDSQSLAINVAANTIYYWKIVTKDVKGNTSDSGVYQFKIN
ncbi:MAG: hypothetical protein ACRYFA_13110 [Janthinobacterium lividum]